MQLRQDLTSQESTVKQQLNGDDQQFQFDKRQSSIYQLENLNREQGTTGTSERLQLLQYNSAIRQKISQTQSSNQRPQNQQRAIHTTQNRQSKGLNAFTQYLQEMNGQSQKSDSTYNQTGFKTSFGSFKTIFNIKHLNNIQSAMYTSYNTQSSQHNNNDLISENNNQIQGTIKPLLDGYKTISQFHQTQQGNFRMVNLRDHFNLLKKQNADSELYVWGSNQEGQLGLGQISEDKKSTTFISDPYQLSLGSNLKIAKIACGAGHTVILTLNHQLFSWGCNTLGQLGLGDTKSRSSPTEITALKGDRVVVDIASGAGHCLVLDSYGIVYSWGASADFQTGHLVEPALEGDTKQFIIVPKRLESLCQKSIQVLRMSCGIKHTALINSKNELICFGSNEFGQCGDGKYGNIKTNFDINIHLKGRQLDSIVCGGAHTVVKTQIQEIFSFGLNDKGQLGLGVMNQIVPIPQKIKNFTSFNIIKIDCADESSCALTQNGDIFVWG